MPLKRIAALALLLILGLAATAGLVFTKRFEAFVAYVVLTLTVTVTLVRFTDSGWAKLLVGVASVVAFWEMAQVDEFLGAWEQKELCAKYAGLKAYRAPSLPSELYDSGGRPNFFNSNGDVNSEMLKGFIEFDSKRQEGFATRYVTIDKNLYSIRDARTGQLLAEYVDFWRWPSPFIFSIIHPKATGCAGSLSGNIYRDVDKRVFANQSSR